MISSTNLLESSSKADKTEASSVTSSNIGEKSRETIVSTAKNGFKESTVKVIDWQGCMVRSECDGRPLFQCKHCTFASEWLNVVRHVQRVHKLLLTVDRSNRNRKERKVWLCDICSYKTSRLNLMFRHLLHHGVAGKLVCKLCNYSTNRQVDLEQHDVLCHGDMSDCSVDECHNLSVERNLKCMFCDAVFGTVQGLDDHTHSEHHMNVKSYACSNCSKTYLSQLKLKKHMWMAHSESAIAQKMIDQRTVVFCPYCRYYSNRKNLLKNHVISRHPQQSKNHASISLASVNRGITSTKKSLSKVKKRLKKRPAKRFHCSHCSFQSKWKYAVSRHKLRQHQLTEPKQNEREIINLCNSSSPDKLEFGALKGPICEVMKDQLIDEFKSDLDKGDFIGNHKAYDILFKEFTSQTTIEKSLQNSEQTKQLGHSSEVSSNCHTELNTYTKDTTKESTKFTTGRTTFCCKYCSKDLRTTHRLARHISSHLNLKQFKCNKCDYRCNARENLITHARTQHNLLETSAFLVELSRTEALATINDYKSRFPVKHTSLAIDSIPVSEYELGLGVAVTSDPCRNDSSAENAVITQSPDSITKNVKTRVGSHACKVCSKVFCTPRRLAAHKIIHSDFKKYKCKKCVYRSNDKSDIKKHAYKVHRISTSVPFVEKLSPSAAEEMLNVQPSVDNNSLERSKKKINFNSAAEVFACSKCSMSFPTVYRLSKHVVIHDDLRPFKCSECGHRCNFRYNLINHLKLRHKILLPESCIIRLSPTEAQETIDVYRSQAQAAHQLDDGYSTKHQVTARKTRPVARCRDQVPVVVHNRMVDQQASPDFETDVVHGNSTDKDALCSIGSKKKNTWNYSHRKKPKSGANCKSFMCTECGFRSRWSSSVYHHKRVKNHPKARVVKVQVSDAKRLRSAVCSVDAISENHRYKKHLMSKGLLRYKCDRCGYRSDWGQNVKKHISSQHATARVVHLSAEEARETLADYKAKICLPSLTVSPDVSPDVSPVKPNYNTRILGSVDKLRLRRFSCSLCNFRSDYLYEVTRHCRVKHAGIESTVQILPENVARATLAEYKTHYFGHKRKQFTETSIVGDSDAIEGEDEMVSSTPTSSKQRDKDGEFFCNICPYQASRSHHLESHLRMHTARPGCAYKCSHCSYYTSNDFFLKQHLALHEDASSSSVFTRTTADDTLSEPVVESHSQRVEKKHSLFSCDHCPFISKYSDSLLSHKQLHRHRASASFKCSHCAFWTKNQHIINQHMEVHNPDYVEKRTSKLLGTSHRPRKLPIVEVTVEQEIIETATIKGKLIANRFSSRSSLKGPRRTISSPGKLQKTVDLTRNVEADDISVDTMQSAVSHSPQVFNVILASEERRTSRNQQLWRCDKCPYSVDSVLLFKRHVYLHGRNLTYECLHCDYSVPSCWRMEEHRRLHLVENQNLLHSQSVSNLLFLPSRLQTLNDELTCGERLNLLEDSSDFQVASLQPFRCNRCPFVSSRKVDFHAHLRCHFSRGDHSCPFCDFSSTVSSVLTSHVVLHFSLPGCDTNPLPPCSSEMQPWKSLHTSIDSFSTNSSNNDQSSHCKLVANGCIRSKANTKSLDDGPERHGERDSISKSSSVDMSSENRKTAVLTRDQQRQLRREKWISSNQDSSMLDNGCYNCQYCDRPFVSSDLLAKHEDVHLSHSFFQ